MTGVSIIIRTLNEADYLRPVLAKIMSQTGDWQSEVILIDSDSKDDTLEIAASYHCNVLQIPKAELSWGRSLNMGMAAAKNEYCVLLSGHCLPVTDEWLESLIRPLYDPSIAATCGRQVPRHGLDPFEEAEIEWWFPPLAQNTSFLMFTSANSAINKSLWQRFPFDETINSLEDADVSARLKQAGYDILYVPAAVVYHSHPISVSGIYRRWYWRGRVGMYLRRDTNPKIRKAASLIWPYFAPFKSVFSTTSRYFFQSIGICLFRGYAGQLWKAFFYEMVREYAVYTGIRDGLLDVRADTPPRTFSYHRKQAPLFVRLLKFIE